MTAADIDKGNPVIELSDVTIRRGGRLLLDRVNLLVRAGEVLALVGPNGAGKSTLLGLIAGDIDPDGGVILLDGTDLGQWPIAQLARFRAVLPQQTMLQFGFSGREVVAMGRTPLPATERRHDVLAIEKSLAETESSHLAERRFPTLSGGEQTRISFSRVLAQETKVVLLDEPTAALDVRHQLLVMQRARELASRGIAVIAILHDLNLAMSHADRIAVLADGQLIAAGTPWDVVDDGLLDRVFRCPLAVLRHPVFGCPLVLPLRSDASEQGPDLAERKQSRVRA